MLRLAGPGPLALARMELWQGEGEEAQLQRAGWASKARRAQVGPLGCRALAGCGLETRKPST